MTSAVHIIADEEQRLTGYASEEILWRFLRDKAVGSQLPPVVRLGACLYEDFILSVVKNRIRHWGQETYYDGPCGWVRIEKS
jgi:hypothetical protein